MKSIDEYFADWEGAVFGYGYGSGEEHTIGALKTFLESVPLEGGYDYQKLEAACTPAVAWLLINTLARAGVIEYGCSPRFAWLTPSGVRLAEYIRSKTLDELCAATDRDQDAIICRPDGCNCQSPDCRLLNPFWAKSQIRA